MADFTLASWQNFGPEPMIDLQKERLTVAVIFAPNAAKQIELLAGDTPLWVIESSKNVPAVAEARKKHQSPLTVFFVRPGESKMDMCSRVLFNIDDHHEFSELKIYGASLEDIDIAALDVLKIDSKQQTDYGCLLARKYAPIDEGHQVPQRL
jgi:hypothetical protein